MDLSTIRLLQAYPDDDPDALVQGWIETINFERDTEIEHIYLLGWVNKRLGRTDSVIAPYLPRIRGFERWLWAKQKLYLNEIRTVQQYLTNEGIATLLPALLDVKQLRLSWEYDKPTLLIREADREQALTVLREKGWRIRDYYTPPSRYRLIPGLLLWSKKKGHLHLRWWLNDHYWGITDEEAIWERRQEDALHPHDQTLWTAQQFAAVPKAAPFFLADILYLELDSGDWQVMIDRAREVHVTQHLAGLMRGLSAILPGVIGDEAIEDSHSPLERLEVGSTRWLTHQVGYVLKDRGLSAATQALNDWFSFKTLPGRIRHRVMKKVRR